MKVLNIEIPETIEVATGVLFPIKYDPKPRTLEIQEHDEQYLNPVIQVLTIGELHQVVSDCIDGLPFFYPFDFFIAYDDEVNKVVAVHNPTDGCYVEEFNSVEEALKWLGGYSICF